MVYRIPQLSANLRQRSAAQLEPRAQPRAARPNSPRRQIDLSSRRGCRQHFLAATRKSTNRRPYGAFCARREGSLRTEQTTGSESWPIPKCRHYVIGPTGIGKSWLACALAHKACRDGFFAIHKRMAELFRDLAVARADGSIGSVLAKLARTDVLVLDDFAMAPMKDSERRDFLEICDDRYQRRSTVLTSQVPVAHWHEQIGDPSIADSIMDRLVHNAHRMDLDGESIRKKRARKPAEEDGK
jgi:hypothetical protein